MDFDVMVVVHLLIAVRQRRQPGPADQGGGPARPDVAHQDLPRPRHTLGARLPPRQGEEQCLVLPLGPLEFRIFIFAISCYPVCSVRSYRIPQSSQVNHINLFASRNRQHFGTRGSNNIH